MRAFFMTKAKPLPDLEYLKRILDYDPLTGVFRWKEKVSRKTVVGAIAGTIHKAQKRWQIQINGSIYKSARLAYYMHNGAEPVGEVDHKNMDTLDNRAENLRDASKGQNGMNKGLQANNTSGFKGVSYHKARGEFIAYAKANGKTHFAGWHKTAESAALAAKRARETLHGEFTRHE
ncbi:MAG: zinc-binding loop region of homing endonuclease [Bacteriophage sp.]|nr:MAG: zinc-binding loop region of homing endonuclease [Bacteriophage sp.]